MPNPFVSGESAQPNGENTRPNGENTRPLGENTRPLGENTRPRDLTISHSGMFFPGTAFFGKNGKNSSVFEQWQK